MSRRTMRDIDNDRTSLSPNTSVSAASMTSGCLLSLRVLSISFSVAFAIILYFTIKYEGSPFYYTLLEQKWMRTTLIDYYLTLLPLCALAFWRERSSPLWAIATVIYFCSLGSTAVWSYIFLMFYKLKSGDAVSKILE